MLMDLTVNGRKIPALIQNTKQGLDLRPQSRDRRADLADRRAPGHADRGAGQLHRADAAVSDASRAARSASCSNGITDEFLLDYTPELKRRAQEILSKFRVGGLYVPPLPYPHKNTFVNNVGCVGGLNIYHPPVADPDHRHHVCAAREELRRAVVSRADRTARTRSGRSSPARARKRGAAAIGVTPTTGTTVAAWKQGGPATGRLPLIDGLPVYKPLFQGLAAYDMNTGEKLWDVPIGQTPERIKNHPLLKGVDVSATRAGPATRFRW